MDEHVIKIEHPEVPQQAIDFANEIAAVAAKYSIKHCDVTYKLNDFQIWRQERKPHGLPCRETGVFVAHCELVDQRGRPFSRVSVEIETKTKVLINDDPHSMN